MRTALDKMMNWPAYMDMDAVSEVDSKWDDISSRRSRRLLLSMLTMDSEKLFEICESDPETFFEGFQCSASTLGMYKRIVKLLDIGHHRLMAGLCSVGDVPFSEEEFHAAAEEAKAEDIHEKTVWPALRLVSDNSDADEGGES